MGPVIVVVIAVTVVGRGDEIPLAVDSTASYWGNVSRFTGCMATRPRVMRHASLRLCAETTETVMAGHRIVRQRLSVRSQRREITSPGRQQPLVPTPPDWCPVSRRPVPAVGHKTADFCSATVRWSPSPGAGGCRAGVRGRGCVG